MSSQHSHDHGVRKPHASSSLEKWAWLSVAAAVFTIALKLGAWWWTDSVGLFSDAMESFVNLAAALFAVMALRLAETPADENHHFGHDKIEYFAGGFEGSLILLAAALIAWAAIDRFIHPQPLQAFGVGVLLASLASVINGVVGAVLMRVGKTHDSVTLESDGHHLLTDVWTSVGVIVGIVAVMLTGWWWLDPVIALLVAANIVFIGSKLLWRAWKGLMDEALDAATEKQIVDVLNAHCHGDLQWHALRHRKSGRRMFATVHVLVPGQWRMQRAHDLSEVIEQAIAKTLPALHLVIHLEPLEDERAYQDQELSAAPITNANLTE